MSIESSKKLALSISLIACPNCNGKLYPHKSDTGISNIRCDACGFEALFYTIETPDRSKELVFSIEKEDADRLMAQKARIPPVILHWLWKDDASSVAMEAADLYPFIPYTFLHAADVSLNLSGQQNNSLVFLQSDDLLPKMRIYTNPSDDREIAEIISNWNNRSTSQVQVMFNFGYSHAAKIIDMANEIRRKKGIVDDSEPDEEEE